MLISANSQPQLQQQQQQQLLSRPLSPPLPLSSSAHSQKQQNFYGSGGGGGAGIENLHHHHQHHHLQNGHPAGGGGTGAAGVAVAATASSCFLDSSSSSISSSSSTTTITSTTTTSTTFSSSSSTCISQQLYQQQQQQQTAAAAAATITTIPLLGASLGGGGCAVATPHSLPPLPAPHPPSSAQFSHHPALNGGGAMTFSQNGPSALSHHNHQHLHQNVNNGCNGGLENGFLLQNGKLQQQQLGQHLPLNLQQLNTQQQPGAWFFPQRPPSTELDSNDTAGLGSPCSPGLLAPQQLLARFGPRHCTDSVEVPSSEHVAEIVGRQGCKIKALRAKTNTYIKTPVRGEEPVFVVTGRQEDVADARREIECAAEHFTQIRASRRHSQGACPAPGHVTAYVRVPLRVVGLVVGPKGNTIKRIQQDTHTYIITPSREREPIFEVTGLPANVEAARREIENHIYQRTGNMPITDPNASIANYDLQAAAIQAQQAAALHSNSGQRPNYGALAVVCPRSLSLMNGSGTSRGCSSPYNPQHQNGALSSNNHFGPVFGQQLASQHDFGATKLGVFGGGPPVNGLRNGTSTTASTNSIAANNLHMIFNALDLDGGTAGSKASFGAVGHLQHPTNINNNGNQPQLQQPQLYRSISNTTSSSAFSPWTSAMNGGMMMNGGGNFPMFDGTAAAAANPSDFLNLFSSKSSQSPLAFSLSNGCQSSFSAGSSLPAGGVSAAVGPIGSGIGGIIVGATGTTGGGLSSENSSSRDEGLGDSPTNSFGRPHGSDPYQHLMTIWSDLLDQPPSSAVISNNKISAEAPLS